MGAGLDTVAEIDQEALVLHVDEMANLAAKALQRLYSARLSSIETMLYRLPSTLTCLEFNMAQESIEQLQPGFTFKGALHDFATALQGPPSCTLPSSYSPAAPLNPSGFDLHLAFAAHDYASLLKSVLV